MIPRTYHQVIMQKTKQSKQKHHPVARWKSISQRPLFNFVAQAILHLVTYPRHSRSRS